MSKAAHLWGDRRREEDDESDAPDDIVALLKQRGLATQLSKHLKRALKWVREQMQSPPQCPLDVLSSDAVHLVWQLVGPLPVHTPADCALMRPLARRGATLAMHRRLPEASDAAFFSLLAQQQLHTIRVAGRPDLPQLAALMAALPDALRSLRVDQLPLGAEALLRQTLPPQLLRKSLQEFHIDGFAGAAPTSLARLFLGDDYHHQQQQQEPPQDDQQQERQEEQQQREMSVRLARVGLRDAFLADVGALPVRRWHLDVSHNSLSAASLPALPALRGLVALGLCGNAVGDAALAQLVRSCATLRDLRACSAGAGPETAAAIGASLLHTAHLAESGNALAAALASRLHGNRTLRDLDLSRVSLRRETPALLAALQRAPLQRLRVAGCEASGVAALPLDDLELLDFSDNPKAAAEALLERVVQRQHRHLALHVDGCRLDGLPSGLRVVELHVRGNRLDTRAGAALAAALGGSLRRLEAADNNLGAGVWDICRALVRDSTLRRLGLERNGLGESAAEDLADALESNSTLFELVLDGNRCGDGGASSLARVLAGANTSLQEIRMAGNQLGPHGAMAFAQTLCYNTSLQRLDLSQNLLGARSCSAIARALETNKSLRELNLSQTALDTSTTLAMAKMLHVNRTLHVLSL